MAINRADHSTLAEPVSQAPGAFLLKLLVFDLSRFDASLAAFFNFLRDELKPYPGRWGTVGRMALTAMLTMFVIMTMRGPYGAIGVFFGLTLSRENPASTLKNGVQTLIACALGLLYILVGVTVFINDPLAHFLFLAFSLALMFFIIRTFKSLSVAFGFCFVVVSALPVWNVPFPVDAHVDQNVWSVFGVFLGVCITMIVEFIFCPQQPDTEEVQKGLIHRLDGLQALLQAYLMEDDVSAGPAIANMKQLARLGAGRLKGFLARTRMEDDSGVEKAQWGAIIAMIERSVDTAASLGVPRKTLTNTDKNRLRALQTAYRALQTAMGANELPPPTCWNFPAKSSRALPLLPELERHLEQLPHLPERLEHYHKRFRLHSLHWRQLFVADAFINAEYLHFAVKGMLTGMACYVFYSAVDWPGLGISLVTCVITALSTVGSSRQKQILRIGGAVFGGLILGMGSQIYILPYLDTILGFSMLFVLVTGAAAWFATSSPRLAYFGVQMALAFYLIMFQSAEMETSLSIARDQVMGILLGLVAMWCIFDQLWAKPAIQEMKDAFTTNMRALEELSRIMISPAPSLERMNILREQIGNRFSTMNQNADMVLFEFGGQRARHLYWRSRIKDWQTVQETLLLNQLAINHYRSRVLPATWPDGLQEAIDHFTEGLMRVWQAIANSVTHEGLPDFEKIRLQSRLTRLRQEAFAYLSAIDDEIAMHSMEAILDLDEQQVSLTERLLQDVHQAAELPEKAHQRRKCS